MEALLARGLFVVKFSLSATNRFQTNNPLSLIPVYLPLGFIVLFSKFTKVKTLM